jgi:hypothetical protein
MTPPVVRLARSAVLLAGIMLLVSLAVVARDLHRAGLAPVSLGALSVADARHLTSVFSRASNQLMAIVFTAIAIAVPLTANMYSLKFLEYFLRDRVNAVVLVLVVFANVNTTLLSYALKDGFVPGLAIHAQLALMVVGGSLLCPYVYYVFRFLHPSTLLERLEQEVERHLREVGHTRDLAGARAAAAGAVEHIGNIAIRSIDRLDRTTAVAAVQRIEHVLRGYWARKPALPAAWFEPDRSTFPSFSGAALREMHENRGWVEMKALAELRQITSAGLNRMHDLVSAGARALRRLGAEEAAVEDRWVRELVVEYFNTLVRAALNARDVRSVFIIFEHYRAHAESLVRAQPEQVAEIAGYFEYYAQVARELNLTFVVEVVAHDLGRLVEHAWGEDAANREALLRRFLAYGEGAPPLPGTKKAQAILASYFLSQGERGPAALVAARLARLDHELLRRVRDELLSVEREKYWEVNERRLNLDYVPPERRETLRSFFEELAAPA